MIQAKNQLSQDQSAVQVRVSRSPDLAEALFRLLTTADNDARRIHEVADHAAGLGPGTLNIQFGPLLELRRKELSLEDGADISLGQLRVRPPAEPMIINDDSRGASLSQAQSAVIFRVKDDAGLATALIRVLNATNNDVEAISRLTDKLRGL